MSSTWNGIVPRPDFSPTMSFDNRDTNFGSTTQNMKRKLDNADEEYDDSAKKLRSNSHRPDNTNMDQDSPLGEDAEITSRISPYDHKKTYAASGLKRSLHGAVYQLKHLMLVTHRVWKKNYSFCLSTEMDAAEKFDDLVLEFQDSTGTELRRFVQLKHKQNESETIGHRRLLDTDGDDFSVQKYFISWRKIVKHSKFGSSGSNIFILCTNIDLDAKGLKVAGINLKEVKESDEFLRVTNRATQPPRYKLLVKERSKLWNRLKSASDVHRLANALAEHVFDFKKIELKTAIFKDYHVALAKEVIDGKRGKFFDNFIKNINLSAKAQKFRQIFLINMKQLSRHDISGEMNQDILKKYKLDVSDAFGKRCAPATRPVLTDVEQFSQQFVQMLNNVGNDYVVTIDRQRYAKDQSSDKKFSDNIDNLAGHVLVKKNKKIRVRRQFLDDDDTQLSGNIGEFKAAIKNKFNSEFGDLEKFEFKINKFKTCTEEEFSSKTELPDDDVDNKEILRFLDEFILAVQQPNEIELGEMMKREMGAYSQFNLLNADFINDSFQNEILDWFKKTGTQCEFLKNEDANVFFDRMETKLTSLVTIGLNLPYPAELEKFDIRYKREISDLQNFLDTSIRTRKPILELISTTQTLLTALRIYQTLVRMEEYVRNDSYIFIHLDKLLLPRLRSLVLSAFKSRGSHNLLIIDCELMSTNHANYKRIYQLWNELRKIVNGNSSKRIILIIQGDKDTTSEFEDCSETHREEDEDISVNNLEERSRQKLLEKKLVNFQGQEERKTSFADLLNIQDVENHETQTFTDFGRIINPNTLILLIKDEEVRIGSKISGLDEIRDYYINRTVFRHVVIKSEVLNTPEIPDLFAISGIGRNALVRDEDKYDIFRQRGDTEFHPNEYVILEYGHEKEQFENLCEQQSNRNVHWLESGTGQLIWQQTFGNINNLIEFQDEYRAENENCSPDATRRTVDQLFSNDEQSKIVIISDVAGMGKSTVLSYLEEVMKTHRPNMLVIRIDLTRHTAALKKLQEDQGFDSENTHRVVDFIVEKIANLGTVSESETFKVILKGQGEAVLLFDGFDEIYPRYEDTVINLLRGLAKCRIKKLFVTTRPHTKQLLEKKMGTFSHVMQPFNRENQIDFLTNFWKKGLSSNKVFNQNIEELLRGHAEAVTEILKKSIDTRMQEFTGVPLQTRLVAEIFPYGKEETLPETIDIIILYQTIIDRKYEIYCAEKKRADQTNVREWKDSRLMFETVFQGAHEKLALDLLFDEKIVSALLSSQPQVHDYYKSCMKAEIYHEGTGIITRVINGEPEFIHRTFAEYFAAVFLHRALNDDTRNQEVREFFVSQLLLKPEYKTIRAFMNCILMRENNAPHDENKSWGFSLRDKRNACRQTLFHIATEECTIGILRFFLSRFSKHRGVTDSIIGGVISQKEASNAHASDEVNHSLNQQADIDLEDINGRTPLHIALTTRNASDLVKCLIDGGADIHCRVKDGETPLHLAAEAGNFDKLKYLVEVTHNLFHRDKGGATPLYIAAQSGNLETVEFLVENGADIHCEVRGRWTPLHSATLHGCLNVVEYFVEKGADCYCQTEDRETLLHIAALSGNLDLVKFFVGKGIDIHRQAGNGETPLHKATQSGSLAVIKYFLEKGADVHCQGKSGWTLLHLAAIFGYLDIIKYFIEEGADVHCQVKAGQCPVYNAVSSRNEDVSKYLVAKGIKYPRVIEVGATPLHLAVQSHNLDVIKYFIEKGADIKCQTNRGETPLHIAAGSRNLDGIKYFVEKGADIDCQTKDGCSPLHYAAQSGNLNVVKYFVEKCAAIKYKMEDGCSPLYHAAKSGNLNVVEYFVNQGASINCRTKNGRSPLHGAAESQNFDVVKYFVEKGAVTNCQSKDGCTPLHEAACGRNSVKSAYFVEKRAGINCNTKQRTACEDGCNRLHNAAESRKLKLVKYLVDRGAVIDCQTKDGCSPLHKAAESGNLEVIKYFVEKGTDINRQMKNGNSPLHCAILSNNLSVVEYFVKKGANLECEAEYGSRPIHYAAATGNLDVVEYLIKEHADFKSEVEDGCTPLQFATQCGSLDVVRYFVEKGTDYQFQPKHGKTALHFATKSGNLDLVKYFVEKGIDIQRQDKNGDTPLHVATQSGYLDAVKYFVEKGADIQCRDRNGKTPLHMAAHSGNLDVVKYYVQKGADIECTTKSGLIPLHFAAMFDNLDVVKYLVEKGADIQCQVEASFTLLHFTACFGNLDVVRYFVEKGADIHCQSENGHTPLHVATQSGKLDVIKYLVERGAGIQCRDKNGDTPLHFAAFSGNLDIVEYFVKKGVDIQCRDKDGDTPLHISTQSGNFDVVKYFVEQGADIQCQNRNGKTPLHIATQSGNLDRVTYFVEIGADIQRQDKDGHTPLHISTQSGNLEVVRYFVEKGADIHCQNKNSKTPLHIATQCGNLAEVTYFVEIGADVQVQDKNGDTPLHFAASSGNLDLVKYFVEKGADIQCQDKDGDTPLHSSALSGSLDVVKYFIEKGVNILQRQDKNGNTLLHFAASSGNLDVVKYLVEKGADIQCKDKNGDTPLHVASQSGYLDVVKYFVEIGAYVQCENENGQTLLHFAASSGNLDVVKYFVEKGANIQCQDKNGDTPLYFAASSSNLGVIKYFVEKGAGIRCRDKDGDTPLHEAANAGSWDAVQFLIAQGADIDHQNNSGHTPLSLAISKHGDSNMIRNSFGILETDNN